MAFNLKEIKQLMLVLVTWYINRKMFNSKLRLKKKIKKHTELQPPTTPSSSTVWYWEVVGALASQASDLGSISHFFFHIPVSA